MSTNVVSVQAISSVASLQAALQSGRTSFPVLNTQDKLIGVINSRFIARLIEKGCWSSGADNSTPYDAESSHVYQSWDSQANKLQWLDLQLSSDPQVDIKALCAANAEKMIDLTPYMVEKPMSVHTTDDMTKVLGLFRHMQLKMLPVLDSHLSKAHVAGVITRYDLLKYSYQW